MTTAEALAPLTFDLPDDFFGVDDDRKSRNETRAREAGLEPCTHCGRGIKPGTGWITVVVDGGASAVNPNGPFDESDPGFMGLWVLGSACGRKIPVGARARYLGFEE